MYEILNDTVEKNGHIAKTVKSKCGASFDRVCTLCGEIVEMLDYDDFQPTKAGCEPCKNRKAGE